MEFRNLNTFVRVAELQSFSQAAVSLGYSQSAVTVQIHQLEKELNVRLFERIGKKVRLTKEGNQFLSSALKILRDVEEAKVTLRGQEQPKGILRIGAASSLVASVLPPILLKFGREYPEVEVIVRTGTISELFDMVRHNDCDLLFFLDQPVSFAEWRKVFDHKDRIVFAAASGHPLAGKTDIPLEEVISYPMILTEQGISYRYHLEQEVAKLGLKLHPYLELGSTEVIAKLVASDGGISYLPEYVVRDRLRSGELVTLDVKIAPNEMWTQLVYHKNKWITPQMRLFMDALCDEYAAMDEASTDK